MALISLRIPDDVAARLAALAAPEGGKSALLRRLIAKERRGLGATGFPRAMLLGQNIQVENVLTKPFTLQQFAQAVLPESYEALLYHLQSHADGHKGVACEANLRPVPLSFTRNPKAFPSRQRAGFSLTDQRGR